MESKTSTNPDFTTTVPCELVDITNISTYLFNPPPNPPSNSSPYTIPSAASDNFITIETPNSSPYRIVEVILNLIDVLTVSVYDINHTPEPQTAANGTSKNYLPYPMITDTFYIDYVANEPFGTVIIQELTIIADQCI